MYNVYSNRLLFDNSIRPVTDKKGRNWILSPWGLGKLTLAGSRGRQWPKRRRLRQTLAR